MHYCIRPSACFSEQAKIIYENLLENAKLGHDMFGKHLRVSNACRTEIENVVDRIEYSK